MINGTFFVQLIHFFIAYCIIDRLFLRTAVSMVTGEEKEESALQQSIERAQHEVDDITHQSERRWRRAKKSYDERAPVISAAQPVAFEHELNAISGEEKIDMNLVDSFKKALQKRVIHE